MLYGAKQRLSKLQGTDAGLCPLTQLRHLPGAQRLVLHIYKERWAHFRNATHTLTCVSQRLGTLSQEQVSRYFHRYRSCRWLMCQEEGEMLRFCLPEAEVVSPGARDVISNHEQEVWQKKGQRSSGQGG